MGEYGSMASPPGKGYLHPPTGSEKLSSALQALLQRLVCIFSIEHWPHHHHLLQLLATLPICLYWRTFSLGFSWSISVPWDSWCFLLCAFHTLAPSGSGEPMKLARKNERFTSTASACALSGKISLGKDFMNPSLQSAIVSLVLYY